MKLKHLFILVVFLFATVETFSQEDTRSEIMNYQESEFAFVNKARRLLGTHIKDGNIIEATKVKDVLLDEFNGAITEAFYNSEYIHLLFALREYEQLLVFMKQLDINQKVSQNVYTSAQTDNLGTLLIENTLQFNDIFAIDIKENVDDEMDKAFLILLLSEMAYYSPSQSERNEHTESVNKLANEYLANYPDSPYEKVVRENIRFEFGEAKWGFYWDIGIGPVLNNGELKNTFGNSGFGLDMGFEYRHRQLFGQLEIGLVASSLKKDIEINNTIWQKSSSATFATFALNAGYIPFENRRWSIYPFAGIGFSAISAPTEDTKNDPNLQSLKLNTFSPQIGMGVDYKLYSSKSKKSSYGRLSLRYKYKIYNFEKTNPLFQGNQQSITLSFGFGGRPLERKK